MKKIFLTFFLFFTYASFFVSETPAFDKKIQIHIWSELDAYPELKEAQNTDSGIYDYAIQRLKDLAPFLINGMVYGWTFTYTPSDKLRNVEEYFEITPVSTINTQENPIQYKKPWIQDNLVHIWIEYERTDNEAWSYKSWTSISKDKSQGMGKAPVKEGFNGINDATRNAIKDGIRNYYRPIIKNKPKEISGKIILSNEPKIGITEGSYTVKLDFFLETNRIIKYTMF